MKKQNVLPIWGVLLIALGLLLLLGNLGVFHSVGRILWALVIGGIGVPFLLVYLSDRNQWWSLIPGCTMVGVGAGILFGGTLAAIVINGSIALAFALIFLTDRRNWWALIPAWVMTSVCAIIFLSWIGLDWLVAPFVMFAIALPFLVVYIIDRDQWWALIPGGIMGVIGVFILIGEIMSISTLGPALIILVGVWLLYRAFKPKKESAAPSPSQFSSADLPEPDDRQEEPR